MAAILEDDLQQEFSPKEATKTANTSNDDIDLDSIELESTRVHPSLLLRARSIVEYFHGLSKVVPLYGNFVPQYPRRPTSGRKLTPRDFGVKDDKDAVGEGGGTAKGLRGSEQIKDKAINTFNKTGRYK